MVVDTLPQDNLPDSESGIGWEGDRDGVSGVLMLDVLDDAENRGGRGAREKPRGYAGGAELEKGSNIIFRF